MSFSLNDLPLREDLVGEEPYGAPQLDVPVMLNVNENPFPPSAKVRAQMGEAVRESSRIRVLTIAPLLAEAISGARYGREAIAG